VPGIHVFKLARIDKQGVGGRAKPGQTDSKCQHFCEIPGTP